MFYLFLLAHLVADFVLQPLRLIRRKNRWHGLLIHIGIVLLCMLALIPLEPAVAGMWPTMLAICAVHLATDRWKVCYADKMLRPPLLPFLFDQAVHLSTLAIALQATLPPGVIWDLGASPLARPALYACGYVVAALATPIAMMVWLDPTFKHEATAGRARRRSIIAAASTLTLTLVAGTATLPVTLAGLVFAARRPASEHPLDTPVGVFGVAVVTATIGIALVTLL